MVTPFHSISTIFFDFVTLNLKIFEKVLYFIKYTRSAAICQADEDKRPFHAVQKNENNF